MKFKLLLVAGLLFFAFNQINTEPKAPKNYVKVFYFHGDVRCVSCNTIEKLTKEAVNDFFGKKLKSKDVVFKILNIDRDKNKKYVEKYDLYNQALIVVLYKNGKQIKYKNCEKIWEKLGDRGDFRKYVKDEINKFLKLV